jgi:3-dehydroquinate synthase
VLGFALFHADLQREELLAGLEEFREHLGGRLAITLLRDIGVGFEVNEMNVALIRESIAELTTKYTKHTKAGTLRCVFV